MHENQWKDRLFAFCYIAIAVFILWNFASYLIGTYHHDKTTVQSIREEQQRSIGINQRVTQRVGDIERTIKQTEQSIRESETRLERAERILSESKHIFEDIRRANETGETETEKTKK